MSQTTSRGSQLEQIWLVVRRRRRFVFLFTCLIVLLVGVFSVLSTRYYRAVTTLEIKPKAAVAYQSSDIGHMGPTAQWRTQYESYYSTQYEIIESHNVLSSAVESLRVEHGISDFDTVDSPHGFLRSHLTISPRHGTYLVDLVVEYPDPDKAALFANQIAQSYIDYNHTHIVHDASEALTWLEKRQQEYREAKKASDRRVIQYRQEHDLVDADGDGLSMMTLEQLELLLSTARAQRVRQEAIVQELEKLSRQGDRMALATHLGQTDTALASLLETYYELEQERDVLRARYKSGHPQVQEVSRSLEATEQKIGSLIDIGVSARKTNLEIMRGVEDNLVEALSAVRGDVSEESRQLIDLEFFEAEADRNEEFFRNLDRRQTEVSLAKLMEANNVVILDEAQPLPRPVRPQILANLLTAALMGLLGGVSIAIVREYIDPNVRLTEDLERVLGASTLGVVPLIPSRDLEELELQQRSVYVQAVPTSHASEALRSVRTAIQLSARHHPVQTLVITSTQPLEGKSFISVNLAAIYAMAGQKVLILDGDLRRPTMHERLGLANELGLGDVLAGEAEPCDAIQETHIPNLYGMTAGPHRSAPAELLDATTIRDLLAKLADFDLVVVDTSPAGVVADAIVWASLADGTALVVETDRVRRALVSKMVQRLSTATPCLLGVIVNRLDLAQQSAGYYTSDYYGHEADGEGADAHPGPRGESRGRAA